MQEVDHVQNKGNYTSHTKQSRQLLSPRLPLDLSVIPDWCNLSTRTHSTIRRTSAREQYCTRGRRDVPRPCGALSSAQPLFPHTNKDITPILVLEIKLCPSLLVLQVVCHSGAPSWRSRRLTRASNVHHDDARLHPGLCPSTPAAGPRECVALV